MVSGSGIAPAAGVEVVELALLLPRGQLSALERLAVTRGVTVARLLRQVIREYLARESRLCPETEARQGADSP
jgi:hypothetical protein